ERTLPHEVIPERLGRELGDDLHRLDDVTQRLADLLNGPGLLVLDVDEAVREHLPRRLLARPPEPGRPERAMEARDVLADEMDIARPVLAERRLVVAIADAGDVRQQRVEPDVDGEPLVERDADAPLLAGARDVDVQQPLVLDETDHL